MNVSSMYLSHIDGFSDIDPNAISSKYFMYMLTNTGDISEPIANPSSVGIYQIPSQSRLSPYRKSTFPLDYLSGYKCVLPARAYQPKCCGNNNKSLMINGFYIRYSYNHINIPKLFF